MLYSLQHSASHAYLEGSVSVFNGAYSQVSSQVHPSQMYRIAALEKGLTAVSISDVSVFFESHISAKRMLVVYQKSIVQLQVSCAMKI